MSYKCSRCGSADVADDPAWPGLMSCRKCGCDGSAKEFQEHLKVDYRCPACGSRDVAADASAKWDVDKQEMSLSTWHDFFTCQECGKEGDGAEFKVLLDKEGNIA